MGESYQPVFVGGTGRSGTTILAKLIGAHRDFYAFPTELRFLTDPDGLISLKYSLVDFWSPFHADVALTRFRNLMRYLERRYVGRYPTSYLGEIFGQEVYERAIRAFLSQLDTLTYRAAWAGRSNIVHKALLRLPIPKKALAPLLPEVRYRGPLTEEDFFRLAGQFVADLFGGKVEAEGARGYVEHTPANILHADFVMRLLPRSKLIHVYRDPRDVAASYRTRDWGPSDVLQSARMIQDVLNRWDQVRNRIPREACYELRFEDLIEDTESVIEEICRFLGVDVDPGMHELDLSRHNIGRWRREARAAELSRTVRQ